MKKIVMNVYHYAELKEDAKDVVRAKWRENCRDFNPLESCDRSSIEAIGDALGAAPQYSSYGDIGFDEFSSFSIEEDILELSGSRAMAYIQNNFLSPNEKGKYYCLGNTERRSRCTKTFSCPFTGYYLDDCVIDAWKDWLKKLRTWDKNDLPTVEDFIDGCSESVATTLQADYDYRFSDEGIDEEIEINDSEAWYFADGTEYIA